MDHVKAFGLGLAALAVFIAPGAVGTWIAYLLGGLMPLGAVLPYLIIFMLAIVYMVGETTLSILRGGGA